MNVGHPFWKQLASVMIYQVTEKSELRNAKHALSRIYCNTGALQALKCFAYIGHMYVSGGGSD